MLVELKIKRLKKELFFDMRKLRKNVEKNSRSKENANCKACTERTILLKYLKI